VTPAVAWQRAAAGASYEPLSGLVLSTAIGVLLGALTWAISGLLLRAPLAGAEHRRPHAAA